MFTPIYMLLHPVYGFMIVLRCMTAIFLDGSKIQNPRCVKRCTIAASPFAMRDPCIMLPVLCSTRKSKLSILAYEPCLGHLLGTGLIAYRTSSTAAP